MIEERAMDLTPKCYARVLYRDSESATTRLRYLQCIQRERIPRGFEGNRTEDQGNRSMLSAGKSDT